MSLGAARFSLFTSLGSEDSASLRASLAAYADLLGGRFVSEVGAVVRSPWGAVPFIGRRKLAGGVGRSDAGGAFGALFAHFVGDALGGEIDFGFGGEAAEADA